MMTRPKIKKIDAIARGKQIQEHLCQVDEVLKKFGPRKARERMHKIVCRFYINENCATPPPEIKAYQDCLEGIAGRDLARLQREGEYGIM